MCTCPHDRSETPPLRQELLRNMTYEMSKQIAADPAKAEELGKAVLKYIDTVAPEAKMTGSGSAGAEGSKA